MALFFLITVPIGLALCKLFDARIERHNHDFRARMEALFSRMSEAIAMLPVTRAHAVEEEEMRRVDSEVAQVRETGYRLSVTNYLFRGTNWVTFGVLRLVCLVLCCYLAFHKMIGIGDIVMYQGFFDIIIWSVQSILEVFPIIALGMESFKSIDEIMQSPDVEDNAGKPPLADVHGELQFEHLTFTYRGAEEPAISDFTLHVSAGESIAIVGESGAGKSTLMNLIIGFYHPTAGRILIDGQDCTGIDMRSFRRHLAVVPQSTLLFSGTIRENITYGLREVGEERLREAIYQANAEEFIARLPQGADTRVGENGVKLSGGQRQRIAIARALIRDPKVIILDEATSSLDVFSELQVQRAIEHLLAGRTTFIVAHRLSTIRMCKRIVVMKDGQCIELGNADDLMAQEGEFFKLKTLQV